MGNGPGRNQAKAHFSKVFVLILLPICHSVLFRPTVGLLAHNKRSETTAIASLMQTSTNGHWRAIKTQRTPVASYFHGHLCYPQHVLPVLRGAAVSPQLTAARAAGCGGWTWPGCSLGQQEALTLRITCFFYPSSPSRHPLTVLLWAIEGNHFLLIFLKLKMTWGTLMLSKGHFSGAPMSTKPEKQLHLWNLSSEGVTRAVRLWDELSGTWISPPRGKGWSVLDLYFLSCICLLAQIQKQWLDLRCSIDICRIESKFISGISFLLWCEVHLVPQTKSKEKLSGWSRRDIHTVMEGPRTSANVRLAPCPWWAKLPCRYLLLSSPRSLSALSPTSANFLLATNDRKTWTLGPLYESVILNSVFNFQFHQNPWSRDELLCECSHWAWQSGLRWFMPVRPAWNALMAFLIFHIRSSE